MMSIFFPTVPQNLVQCLAFSRCSKTICWIFNEWNPFIKDSFRHSVKNNYPSLICKDYLESIRFGISSTSTYNFLTSWGKEWIANGSSLALFPGSKVLDYPPKGHHQRFHPFSSPLHSLTHQIFFEYSQGVHCTALFSMARREGEEVRPNPSPKLIS